MNDALLDTLNGLARRAPALDVGALFFATSGMYLLALGAIALGLRELRRNPHRGLVVGLAAGLGLVLAGAGIWIDSQLVTEARPFVMDPDTIQLLPHAADNGFPSDHATVAAAIATAAALSWRRWAGVFALGAFLIGLARVFAGVHYPMDVLAGWSTGAAAAGLAWLAVTRGIPGAAAAVSRHA